MWPALIAAGAGIVGGLLQNEQGRSNVAETNYANQMLSRENRAWQERMSNTAHQREVKDLQAAGLNPALSATGGAGASTPSGGASTNQVAPTVQLPDFFQAINLMQGTKRLELENLKLENDVKKTASDISHTRWKEETGGKGALKTLDMEGGNMIREIFKYMRRNYKNGSGYLRSPGLQEIPGYNQQPPSSGGSLP